MRNLWFFSMLFLGNSFLSATQTYVIIGAGLNGASIASHLIKLVKPGDKIIMLEQNDKGVKKSSKGESRISNRQIKNESPLYISTSRMSDLFYQDLSRVMSLPENENLLTGLGYLDAKILTNAPCYIVGPCWHEEMQKAVRDTQRLSPEYYRIIEQQSDLEQTHTHLQLAPDEMAVVDNQAKSLNPSKAVDFMLALAEQKGVQIDYQSKVQELMRDKSGQFVLKIKTPSGVKLLKADRLAIATNSDIADLFPELKGIVRAEPIPLYYFSGQNIEIDEASFLMQSPQTDPKLLRLYGDIRLFVMKEKSAEGHTKLKVGFHDRGNILPREQSAKMSEDEILDFMQPHVFAEFKKYFPQLKTRLQFMNRTICYYGNTIDQHPILSTLPEDPKVVLLVGLNGNGAKHAPAFGQVAARLLIGQTPAMIEADLSLDISSFAMRRFLKK